MDIGELKSRLKSGKPEGWYIFSGEEDYLKKYYMNELRSAILTDEVFEPFNHTSFDGADFDFASASEAIKSPPMMSDYKLIEWKFANLDGLKESERTALEDLFSLKEEYPCAVFAIMTTSDGFDAGTAKKPSRLASRLGTGFDIINFSKSTDSQLLSWLKKHFDAEGVGVDLTALNALLFRSGRSMEILNNEVIKLCCYAKANGRQSVSEKEVFEIASPTVECDAFALSNAVLEKNPERAFLALTDLRQRRAEPSAVLSMLERVYSELTSVAMLLDEGKGASDIESILKFHPFKTKLYIGAAKKTGGKRLARALSELCRIDVASKSGGLSGYGAIEMFITQSFS
jgi:DNA polymerase-3 subunit delta